MKLFYYKDKIGNFGDDLNAWLWPKLLDGILNEDTNEYFVGIGTILNHKLPEQGKLIVFGSGYGYGEIPLVSERFDIFCVRGPKTAEALGIDRELAITDSAALLAVLTEEAFWKTEKKYKFSFMPHCDSALNADWDKVCELAGIHYIDPAAGVEDTLREIVATEVLITEAMHGAIVADTLRVPWVAVSCYDYINEFKWQDWASTVGVRYSPHSIIPLWNADRNKTTKEQFKSKLKRLLKRVGIWNESWDEPPPAKSSQGLYQRAVKELQDAKNITPILSGDSEFKQVLDRLQSKLQEFKKKYG